METPAALWDSILEKIKEQIAHDSYQQWFSATKAVSLENNVFTISVPDEFIKEWLEGRFQALIKNTAQNVLQTPVNIIITEENPIYKKNYPPYTFQTFVIGDNNRFAHAAALAVAEFPAKSYNPLFIYGGSGLGKTHLMHAIIHKISETKPHFKTKYVTSEQFTNEMIDSLSQKKPAEFREKYRKIDMLLIDDIQFLAGKEGTQLEFFHTFNTLFEANKQIVISSDKLPRDIPTLENRLRSRFNGGLTTDISPPDYETRMAILRTKIKQDNNPALSEADESTVNSVLDLISSSIQYNVRELVGALLKVAAFCSFTGNKLSEELARDVLKDILPQNRPVTTEKIIEATAGRYHISEEDLKGKNRSQYVALPRQVVMYLCRELTDLSLTQIGDTLGGRDHSTILHAVNKIRDMKENDAIMEKTLNDLVKEIRTR
jgi:chromosomal replication initiator protein